MNSRRHEVGVVVPHFRRNVLLRLSIALLNVAHVKVLAATCDSSDADSCAAVSTAGPRAAFCMAGCARSLIHPVVHTSIQRNLIDAFGSSYAVFWLIKLDARCQVLSDPVDREEQLDEARALLRPTDVRYVGARTDDDDRRLGCTGIKDRNNAEQQQHIADCLSLVESNERKTKVKYAWIFRVRPDALWLRRFPHFTYFNDVEEREVFIIGDVLMMVPRKLAKAVLGKPEVCTPGRDAHEKVMVQKLHRAGAIVRYQCDHAICPWQTLKFVRYFNDARILKEWKPWRCVSPLTLMQVLYAQEHTSREKASSKDKKREQKQAAKADIDRQDTQKLGRRIFLNAGVAQLHSCHATPEEECQALLNMTGKDAEEIVKRWGKRPMCGGVCSEPTVDSRDALMECEAQQYT